jgi:hypothetical protein
LVVAHFELILGGAAVYRCGDRTILMRLYRLLKNESFVSGLLKNKRFVSGRRLSDAAGRSKSGASLGGKTS